MLWWWAPAHPDLAQSVPGRDERHVRRAAGPDRTVAYTTAVLIPGQDALNERTLRRSEGAMGPAGFLIADDGEIGMRNQAGLAAELPGVAGAGTRCRA